MFLLIGFRCDRAEGVRRGTRTPDWLESQIGCATRERVPVVFPLVAEFRLRMFTANNYSEQTEHESANSRASA